MQLQSWSSDAASLALHRAFKIVITGVIAALIYALVGHAPDWYFVALRYFVFFGLLLSAYLASKGDYGPHRSGAAAAFLLVVFSLLWEPFLPVRLPLYSWQGIDAGLAVMLILFLFGLRWQSPLSSGKPCSD